MTSTGSYRTISMTDDQHVAISGARVALKEILEYNPFPAGSVQHDAACRRLAEIERDLWWLLKDTQATDQDDTPLIGDPPPANVVPITAPAPDLVDAMPYVVESLKLAAEALTAAATCLRDRH